MWTDMKPAIEMPQLFEQGGDLISLAGGLPDLTRLPLRDIADRLSRLVRLGGGTLLQYSTPHVARTLIPAINDLAEREEVRVPAEQLVPTAGSQMGLMAVALGLGSPGETILCQTPLYPGASTAFRAGGLIVAAAPYDADGIDPDGLRASVTALRAGGATVRLLYANPTFQNPSGATTDVARRAALMEACGDLDLLLVEDNPYGLLAFDGSTTPACHSLDPGRVVYLGTFSKVFAPGLRCGWIAAPAHIAPVLRRTCEVMALSPSVFAQSVLASFHAAHGWSDLITAYRDSYRHRAQLMSDALERELGTGSPWQWDRPEGGFYLWLRHRDPEIDTVDTEAWAAPAAARGVSFVPGRHFSIDGEHRHALRLCFSGVPVKRIDEAISRLAGALSEKRAAA